MIPLPKSVIDNIFEPRREIRTPKELEAAVGRLLWDGKDPKKDSYHHFFRLGKQKGEGGRMFYQWQHPSVRMEDAVHWREDKPAKGKYPAWEGYDNTFTREPWFVRPADTLYELLPEPIHQSDVLEAFYRIALPRYDDIVKIDSWPRVSEPTWLYIMEKFMAFDRRVLKGMNVMAGGCWALGAGFSCCRTREGMPDWQIDLSECKVAYKETPFYFTIHESIYGEQNEYHIFRARLIYDNGIYDNVNKDEEHLRHETVEDAMAACAKRAGEPVIWEPLIGPLNSDGERVWRSHTVQLSKAA